VQRLTRVVALLFLALGLAAVDRQWRGPQRRSARRAAAVAAALQRQTAALRARPALQAEVARLEAALGSDVARLPAAPRLDAFVQEAGRLARRHRVRIVQLAPRQARPQGDVAVLPVDLTLEGDFEHIYAWMVEIEAGPRLVRAETLRAARQPGAGVRAEVRMALFVAGPPRLE
jgi:Tfp pilus assembly protein PilO